MAVRENPGASSAILFSRLYWCLFLLPTGIAPVIATGFKDLRKHANAQSAQSSSHLQKTSQPDWNPSSRNISNDPASARPQRPNPANPTLMRFVQHLHLLIPAVRSSILERKNWEISWRRWRRSRVKGKLNKMWALLGAVGAFIIMER